jgi:hypothetical protein
MRAWQFYSGATDHRGRTLSEILAWDDDALEQEHDFIQWLFPLADRSGANPDAPVLTSDEIQRFQQSPEAQGRILSALRRMLSFYGLTMQEGADQIRVIRSAGFAKRKQNWITPFNHNYLRVTRILKSLRLLGLPGHASAFFECLAAIYAENRPAIGEKTFDFWKNAAR